MEWVLERLNSSISSFAILARWNCGDLVSGASDLEAYELSRKSGARFFVLPDLHAKAVLVDRRELLVSSANITGPGLNLVPRGNREIGVKLLPSSEDLMIIDAMFDEATEVTPDLYDEFRRNVERLKKLALPLVRERWPTELLQKLEKGPKRLWVTELFWCESPSELNVVRLGSDSRESDAHHDLTLLGIEAESAEAVDNVILLARFMESRAWRWLVTRLKEADGQELYFGGLSAALHDALLDDPKPYRQDVKKLVAHLIRWVQQFGHPSVVIDRPNHSQRLRLTH
jgi:hypothetical protein